MRFVAATFLTFCLLLGNCFAQEIHCKHFWHGMPQGTAETNDLIIRDSYAVSTNDETKFADWVAYRLTYREVVGNLPLDRDWEVDASLAPDETLEPDDYRGAASLRYDRGHLVPLASFKGSVNAQEVNRTCVVAPQRIGLNRGVWLKTENWERELVDWYGEIFVLNGTLYERNMAPLPSADEPHRVPSGFWKVIIFQDNWTWKSISLIVDQGSPLGADPVRSLVSIDDIEKISGLTLVPDLPDRMARSFKRAVNKQFVVEELQGAVYQE